MSLFVDLMRIPCDEPKSCKWRALKGRKNTAWGKRKARNPFCRFDANLMRIPCDEPKNCKWRALKGRKNTAWGEREARNPRKAAYWPRANSRQRARIEPNGRYRATPKKDEKKAI